MNMDVWIIGPEIEGEDIYNLIEDEAVSYRKINDSKLHFLSYIKKATEEAEAYIYSNLEYSEDEFGNAYTIDIKIVMLNGKWLVDDLEQIEREN